MNQFASDNFITIEQVADAVGISRQAAQKKLTRIESPFSKTIVNPAGTGRPLKMFECHNALALWGKTPEEVKEKTKFVFRKKSKTARPGPKEKLPHDIEVHLKNRTLELFLSQALRKNVQPACLRACEEFWSINGELEGFDDVYDLSHYLYHKRIMRKDDMYKGYYHKDKWELMHMRHFNVVAYNNEMPTNSWDYISSMSSFGLIGKGYGAGDLWVVDGTQFDAWVRVGNGKQKMLITYMCIRDGITGYPMLVQPVTSENIQEIGAMFLRCVARYGIPKFGVMLDNSRTFKSNAIRSLVEAFYTQCELDCFCGGWDWYKKVFPGKDGPVQFPLAKIPRHGWKAGIERFFNEANKQQAYQLPGAYQGSRESRLTKYELGTVPTYQLEHAPDVKAAWESFENWIYSEYVKFASESLSLKSFQKISGKRPTPLNAWEYYGGLTRQAGHIPEINQARAFYWLAPPEFHHRVAANLGGCIVTHNKTLYNYQCNELTKDYYGDKVCCIPNPKDNRVAFVYREEWGKNEKKVPVLKDITFIGDAWDATYRTKEDFDTLSYKRKANQKIQDAAFTLPEGVNPTMGWASSPRNNELQGETAEYFIEEPNPEPLPLNTQHLKFNTDYEIDIDELTNSMDY